MAPIRLSWNAQCSAAWHRVVLRLLLVRRAVRLVSSSPLKVTCRSRSCRSLHPHRRRHVAHVLPKLLHCRLSSAVLQCRVGVVLAQSMARSASQASMILMVRTSLTTSWAAHSLVKQMRLVLIRWALPLRLVCRCCLLVVAQRWAHVVLVLPLVVLRVALARVLLAAATQSVVLPSKQRSMLVVRRLGRQVV